MRYSAFADRAGTDRLFDIEAGGRFGVGAQWPPVPGARELDLHFTYRRLTPHTEAMAQVLRQAGYLHADPGRQEDVSERGALFVHSISLLPVEYDIAAIDNDQLWLGARTEPLDAPEKRPRKTRPYPLRRE
jgi:hypothetical protein